MADYNVVDLTANHFFKALKSPRRLKNMTSLNQLLEHDVAQINDDPYARYPELNDWEIYAADSHYQEHATHDPLIERSNGKYAYAPTGHFF